MSEQARIRTAGRRPVHRTPHPARRAHLAPVRGTATSTRASSPAPAMGVGGGGRRARARAPGGAAGAYTIVMNPASPANTTVLLMTTSMSYKRYFRIATPAATGISETATFFPHPCERLSTVSRTARTRGRLQPHCPLVAHESAAAASPLRRREVRAKAVRAAGGDRLGALPLPPASQAKPRDASRRCGRAEVMTRNRTLQRDLHTRGGRGPVPLRRGDPSPPQRHLVAAGRQHPGRILFENLLVLYCRRHVKTDPLAADEN